MAVRWSLAIIITTFENCKSISIKLIRCSTSIQVYPAYIGIIRGIFIDTICIVRSSTITVVVIGLTIQGPTTHYRIDGTIVNIEVIIFIRIFDPRLFSKLIITSHLTNIFLQKIFCGSIWVIEIVFCLHLLIPIGTTTFVKTLGELSSIFLLNDVVESDFSTRI